MAETWKKIKADGKDVIEVTRTDAVILDNRRIDDEIRMLEHEIAECDVRRTDAQAKLVIKRQQLGVLPAIAVEAGEVVEEPIGP